MTKNYVCRVPYLRDHTSYDCHLWCTFLKWWYLQQFFSFSKIFIFGVFKGIKGKNDLKSPISVCFALYLRTVDHIIEILIMICRCFLLLFFKKCNFVNIKNYLFFYWPTSTIFLIIICFSSSSVNAKRNSEVCPTSFICVWFFCYWLCLGIFTKFWFWY